MVTAANQLERVIQPNLCGAFIETYSVSFESN
jgi:hypothetical protein